MSLVYGWYTLDLSDTQFDCLIEQVARDKLATAGYKGVLLYSEEDLISNQPSGLCIISKDYIPIGVGFLSDSLDRVWLLLKDDVYKLFIDGPPEIVEELGLVLDDRVVSYQGNVPIVTL